MAVAQVAAVRAGVVVAQVGVAAAKAAAEVVVAAGAVAAEVVVAVGAAAVVAVATAAERTTRRRPLEIRALSVVPARVFLSHVEVVPSRVFG